MSTAITAPMPHLPVSRSEIKDWTKAAFFSFLLLSLTLLLMNPAFAGPTGGATGSSAASSARIVGVVAGWQLIIFAIGAFILSGAFMYTGYAMAFGGKRWSDIANVVYGAVIAGMGPILVAWFFS